MIEIGLKQEEIKNLLNNGYIFECSKGRFLFLEKDEPDITFIELEGGIK